MMNRFPTVVWLYAALAVFFVGANFADWPYIGPHVPEFSFFRDKNQTLGGLCPDGLWQLNQTVLQSSINRMPVVRTFREAGNSLRLAGGQRVKWIIWGKKNPLMLFTNIELPISKGLKAEFERQLTLVAEIIADYERRLALEGWKLLIVPVPTKLGIHRERCEWPVYDSDLVSLQPISKDRSDEVYGFLRARLDEHGIPNVDLQALYRKAVETDPNLLLYATYDTHWSGAGIRIAAKSTAEAIAQISSLKSRTPLRPTFLKVRYVGDLAKAYDPLPLITTWLSSAWEFDDLLLNGEEPNGYTYPTNPIGMVAVVGTSYTGQYTWLINQPVGFSWQLSLHLENVEVQNRPFAGCGSFYSFEQFWKNRKDIAADFSTKHGADLPKVIVWEFPIRDVLVILGHPSMP